MATVEDGVEDGAVGDGVEEAVGQLQDDGQLLPDVGLVDTPDGVLRDVYSGGQPVPVLNTSNC